VAKKSNFIPIMKKNFKQKKEDNKKVDVQHHMTCFVLQAVLHTATGDISNCSYKSKHFTYSCIVCDLHMEALGEVQCCLWLGVRGNRRFC